MHMLMRELRMMSGFELRVLAFWRGVWRVGCLVSAFLGRRGESGNTR